MKKSDTNSFRIDMPHSTPGEEILGKLKSSPKGLSKKDASARLETFGLNRLPEPEKDGLLKRFFRHFHDTLIYVLLASAVITALLRHWTDTGVILGVVVINAVIGFLQEGKAEKALEGIRKMLSVSAHVRREGDWVEENAENLVPGDIVRLRSGDRVPADIRLLEAVSLSIEESALTGESLPAEKNQHPVEPDAGVGDRSGMAFSGTMVTAGRGTGVVTATGSETEIGRISTMISEVETLATPLTRQMDRLGKILSAVIVVMAVAMWFAGRMLHDFTTGELFLSSIGFAVAAIPEGLPAVLTITLALGVQRMASRNAITRKLNAVETLGSVTVICSDKTGTLTKNEMTVKHAVARRAVYDVSGSGYQPEGHITLDGNPAALDGEEGLRDLVEVMAVCNDSHISQEGGFWKVTGEPTEGALLTFAAKAGFDPATYERKAVIPFESENKFMATLNSTPDGKTVILVKGAPDRLLDRCGTQAADGGKKEPLDRRFWEEKIEELSGRGLRVLAAARKEADDGRNGLEHGDIEADLTFIGLAGIIDPPRPEAVEAVALCRTAGIGVKMITGDHAGTASAIGREMGIGNGGRTATGDELEKASDEELRELVREVDIFARTSPEHKLRLVRALQANGEVVAMTGDGVNDAPALKRADVGIAMGIKGTEATKEAADIVLADDNFSTIERAVEEGRTIYDNLRKAIIFILPTNGAEAFVILAAVAFGLVLPITPVQILWVNMITAVTLALALAFEPAEPGVMKRPPRDPAASILGGNFLWRIAFVSLLVGGAAIGVFLFEKRIGMPLDLARTLAVNTLVFGQIFYLFNCRNLDESSISAGRLFANRAVWLTTGILLVMQLVFVYAPFMNTWFGSAPLPAWHWLIPLSIGFVVFLAVESEKAVTRRWTGRKGQQS